MNPKFKEKLDKTFRDVKDLTKQGASDVTDFVNSKMTDENKEKAKKAVNGLGDTIVKATSSATEFVSSKISDEDKQKAKDTFTKFTDKANDLGFNKENLNKAKDTAAGVAGDLTKMAGETLLNASEKLKESTKHEAKSDDVIDVDVKEKTEASEESKETETAEAAQTEETVEASSEETTSNADQGEETNEPLN
jgi:hypothetical protein